VNLRRPAVALAAASLLGLMPAACSGPATTALCGSQALSVAGGAYTIHNNEWRSGAHQCITAGGGSSFTVTGSAIAESVHGGPGGYPSIYKGCHWGACTRHSGLPVRVSGIRSGTVTTSWSTTQPRGSSVYNAAYDCESVSRRQAA
jgi:hypothetical protein